MLTNRTDHLERLAEGLSSTKNVFILKGGLGKKQRRAVADNLAAVPDGVPRVLLATGSYIGEGFDDSKLDTLFLAMPISWRGTLQQYVGRLHRNSPRQEGCPRVRLRRLAGSNACPNVREAAPWVSRNRILVGSWPARISQRRQRLIASPATLLVGRASIPVFRSRFSSRGSDADIFDVDSGVAVQRIRVQKVSTDFHRWLYPHDF